MIASRLQLSELIFPCLLFLALRAQGVLGK